MSTLKEPFLAMPVVNYFYREQETLEQANHHMQAKCGPELKRSSPLDLEKFTHYYNKEMGTGIKKTMIAYKTLLSQQTLIDLKHHGITFEENNLNHNHGRLVNIDPGLLTAERFVLGTGKNYTHRIYLGKCVFADLTLMFQGSNYEALPWTYQDYRDPHIQQFLKEVRQHYFTILRN